MIEEICLLASVCYAVSGFPTTQTTLDESSKIGSDKSLYNHGLSQGDIYQRISRTALPRKVQTWPHGVIIYKLDDKIGCPESAQCSILMRAINHYQTQTCVRFQEWSGEDNYVYIFYNPSSAACWSAVGYNSGQQLLSLGRRCWYQGIVVHELGHSVGLWHEMNRPDRDQYITVSYQNILPGFAPAFDKQTIDEYINFEDDFDLKSIMMYDEYAFAKNENSPTIAAKDKTVIGPIWRKSGLSATDIRRVKKLYNCPVDNVPLEYSPFPTDIKCSFDQHTCGFKSAGSSPWKWHKDSQQNNTDGYVYTSNNGTSLRSDEYRTGYFISINLFGISVEKAKTSPMGCVRFWYLRRGGDSCYLKLRQSYISHTTQQTVVPEDTFDLWESDDRRDVWSYVQIPLYVTNPFKLIFESSPGVDANGLVALDDLEISFTACTEDASSTNLQSTT